MTDASDSAPSKRAMEIVEHLSSGDFSRGDRMPSVEKALFLDAELRKEREAEQGRCAKIADSEELTGTPPLDWSAHELAIVEATVRSTSQSIAAAIRAGAPPALDRAKASEELAKAVDEIANFVATDPWKLTAKAMQEIAVKALAAYRSYRTLLSAAPLTPAQDGDPVDAIDLRTGEHWTSSPGGEKGRG